ncbi:MAG: hypothetical protein NZ455_16905, partial [Bacteroidia bacterium]|nr:hypothetical protein [Bacteroidia bacterium]
NQKRGYNQQIKGQSEEDESDKKSDEKSTESKKTKETYKDKIEKNSKELNGKTIGEYFYEKLRQDSDFRTKDIIFYRIDYQNEFNQIIQTQKAFYPDVLTDEFVQRLFNIIYYQRPLKSQKGLVKLCPFASKYINKEGKTIKIGPRVAPKSSPLAQYKRILEQVNSLEITEYEKRGKREKILSEEPLTPSQRQILIDALQNCEKMTQKQIL